MRFRTVVELHGRTATGLRVPAEVVDALGAGKKPAVTVHIGAYSYRSSIAARGAVFLLPLSAEHRVATGLRAGDDVDVDIELDTAPRTVEVPAELAAVLDADPPLRAAFDRLSYSARLRHALAVSGAKTDATRQRRLDAVAAELSGR